MFKRLIAWLKSFFRGLFAGEATPAKTISHVEPKPAPPLNDTDLEFLFTELLEGVYQARGQSWALKWLHNIEHRVSTERWLEWLQRLGDKLLASPVPNNELASRLVQLGELEVGPVGDFAYNIGMQLLTRNQSEAEPIWEYAGPDLIIKSEPEEPSQLNPQAPQVVDAQNPPDGEFQTITLEQLFELMQQDENLRQLVAQQVGIESDDPNEIIQALVDQFQASGQVTADE